MARFWPPPPPLFSFVLNTKKPRAFLPELGMYFLEIWFRVWLFSVRRAIDIVSLAFPPHPSGYGADEVRAYRN